MQHFKKTWWGLKTELWRQTRCKEFILQVAKVEYAVSVIDVENVFYYFYKNAFFNIIIFLNVFLFSSGEFFYRTKPAKFLLNLLNSCIKWLLSDRFNIAAIKNTLMKSCSPQTLSCILRTVILLGNFSFGLINFLNLSTMVFIQRFLIIFIKTRFLKFFYSCQRNLHQRF